MNKDAGADVLLESDLDGLGELFGWKFSDEEVTIYIEDDGYWRPKMTFNVAWIHDLESAATEIVEKIRRMK
jgi:hypothetical protein